MEDTERAVSAVLAALATAWDHGDGTAFASAFTLDADFVNILGMATQGRAAIAAQHQAIFDTIYKGSHAAFELAAFRTLSDHVALAQIRATLVAPGGPRPGTTKTVATAVLTRADDRWSIASFQNTMVAPPP